MWVSLPIITISLNITKFELKQYKPHGSYVIVLQCGCLLQCSTCCVYMAVAKNLCNHEYLELTGPKCCLLGLGNRHRQTVYCSKGEGKGNGKGLNIPVRSVDLHQLPPGMGLTFKQWIAQFIGHFGDCME